MLIVIFISTPVPVPVPIPVYVTQRSRRRLLLFYWVLQQVYSVRVHVDGANYPHSYFDSD